jgi:hypothetical protein
MLMADAFVGVTVYVKLQRSYDLLIFVRSDSSYACDKNIWNFDYLFTVDIVLFSFPKPRKFKPMHKRTRHRTVKKKKNVFVFG